MRHIPGPKAAPGAAGLATGLAAAVGLLVASLLLAFAGAVPASAASYRYWSFWEGTGTGSSAGWAYQQAGPNGYRPADGSVDGWRFGVGADSSHAAQPRRVPDFAAVCGGTPAVQGKKRVAVVIDYGTPADAPAGSAPPATVARCAVLAPDDTSAQLLARLDPPLRYDSSGYLCAIDGYPRTGCGEVVDATTPSGGATPAAATGGTAARTGSGSSYSAGWAVGAALIVALAGAGYWQTRRRRRD